MRVTSAASFSSRASLSLWASLSWCALGVLGAAATAHAQAKVGELMILQETGPRDKRINMVIIGDGYTAADKDKFKTNIQLVVDSVIHAPPLKEYASYFNVYGIFVASNETGADIPSQGITRDTYFNAHYDTQVERLLVIDDSKGFAVINAWVPEADMHFAVVNSDVYGGSGGPIAVANYTAPEIIAHESEHSFSGLGDEYDYSGGIPGWEAPNTTQNTDRKTTRWGQWILASTPIPTPPTNVYANAIGLFEGAAYNATGWYRPALDCRMRENQVPFCAVCSEAIVLSMYDKVSPIDSSYPAAKTVSASAAAAPGLRVKPKVPTTHALAISWKVDGAVQTDQTGTSFTRALAAGAHTVIARVTDTTRMVRKDTAHVLTDSVAWTVNVSATGLTQARSASAGMIARLDAEGPLLMLSGAGELHWRLSAADGTLIESRNVQAAAGRNRFAWSHKLSAGLYFAEFRFQGASKANARKPFVIR